MVYVYCCYSRGQPLVRLCVCLVSWCRFVFLSHTRKRSLCPIWTRWNIFRFRSTRQETGELLPLEFQEIYDRAPKFPSTAESSAAKREDEKEDRIDVDSFVQVFRDVDDLFEPEDKDDNDNINNLTLDTNTFLGNESTNSKSQHDLSTETTSSLEENDAAASLEKDTGSRDVVRSTTAEKEEDLEEDSDDEREFDPSLDGEIGNIFASLCDTDGLIARPQLEEWDEIVKLMTDGLLGRDELDEIWDSALKSSTGVADEKLDLNGFLSFNTALDELFVFDDDDMDDVIVPLDAYTTADDEDADDGVLNNVSGKNGLPTNLPLLMVVSGKELSPDVLFVSLANADGLVGLDELRQWRELNEMIADGDLLESELIDMFQRVKKSEMDLNKVENEGFVELYNAIDSLFEDEDVTDEMKDAPLGMENGRRQVSRKEELLDAIVDLNNPRGVVVDDDKNSDKGVLPCGLESTDLEQLEILSIVELVEGASTNLIRSKQQIAESELSGNWELLYTSSSAMKFNKGLSGLGGSMPNGRFGSLRQKLVATKLLTDVEYVERIEMVPSSASFDVTVTGTWDLRTSVSLFTGEPSLVMNVVPDRVTYGPTSTRADHWKSLGPMNMLDITYLDEDLRIMRGNTSVDTVFVFRRI